MNQSRSICWQNKCNVAKENVGRHTKADNTQCHYVVNCGWGHGHKISTTKIQSRHFTSPDEVIRPPQRGETPTWSSIIVLVLHVKLYQVLGIPNYLLTRMSSVSSFIICKATCNCSSPYTPCSRFFGSGEPWQ